MEEVCSSIWRLKNGKAPKVCGVTGEMLKAGGGVAAQWLHRIIDLAWRSGSVPRDWQKALIVPIHKKRSRTKCENDRGISLLSIRTWQLKGKCWKNRGHSGREGAV